MILYNFRKYCGLPEANTFEELFGSMPNETVRRYSTIFEWVLHVCKSRQPGTFGVPKGRSIKFCISLFSGPIVLKITYSEITASSRSFLFRHPADVDLWSGGVSERPLPGSMLGPTFACVIATQFSHSRRGDRFWYELPNQPSSFTLGKTLSNSLPGGSRASQGLATNHSKCNEAAPSKIALLFSLF